MQKEAIKVLVIDDDADDAFLIEEAIGGIEDGAHLITVKSRPDDAMVALMEEKFDVVLCDYRLGATTGVDFLKNLRSAGDDTACILLTGIGEKEADLAALEAGANDFAAKIALSPESLDRSMRYAMANAARQRLLATVLNNANAAVVVLDQDKRPSIWNPTWSELAANFTKNDKDAVALLANFVLAQDDHDLTIGDRIVDWSAAEVMDGEETVIVLHDVTERVNALKEQREAEQRIQHLALHDTLTGLPNRAAFENKLADEIAWAKTTDNQFYLLNLDLNRFKEVNDVFGHKVGDGLLIEVTKRLSECLRDNEFVARVGGDEFIALSRKKPGDDIDEPPQLAERFLDSITQTFEIDGKLVRSGVSVGVSVFPQHGQDSELLLSNADAAMYRAKTDRMARRICMFDENMDKNIREKSVLALDLKAAVENGELDIHFQPQALVSNGRVHGFEALARWTHPSFGRISPAQFIPIAEEAGLIIDLGEYILERACEIASNWPSEYSVGVNVSAVQIRHTDFVRVVSQVLERTGLEAERLELEITESVLIDDPEYTKHVLNGLKDLGCSLAMDDFGTGYSSLFSMLSFPFDKVKIDRSFIENIDQNHQAREIVKAVLGLSENLGFAVIAEGVQNQLQVDFLRNIGCQEMQGYLIGVPLSELRTMELIMQAQQPQPEKVQSLMIGRRSLRKSA